MINFENSDISNIVIHHVGNKFEGGGLTLSDGCFLPEDPDVVNLLKSYFLSAFKKDAYYNFLPVDVVKFGADAAQILFADMTLKDATNEAIRDWCCHPEYQTRRIVYRSFSKL